MQQRLMAAEIAQPGWLLKIGLERCLELPQEVTVLPRQRTFERPIGRKRFRKLGWDGSKMKDHDLTGCPRFSMPAVKVMRRKNPKVGLLQRQLSFTLQKQATPAFDHREKFPAYPRMWRDRRFSKPAQPRVQVSKNHDVSREPSLIAVPNELLRENSSRAAAL